MTGYKSKKAAAQDKLAHPAQEPWRESASDYERGVIDGRQMQAQSSVDKAVNRMAQPAQEPASVTYKEVQDSMNALEKGNLYQQVIAEELGERKLYTTPQQRPWVGLTDEETSGFTPHEMAVVKYVSKVLQEKNT